MLLIIGGFKSRFSYLTIFSNKVAELGLSQVRAKIATKSTIMYSQRSSKRLKGMLPWIRVSRRTVKSRTKMNVR